MKISCIVPVYNNAETIDHVLSVLTQIKEIAEIIVIDDKSKDNSVEVIEKYIKENDPNQKIITFYKNEINLGKGGNLVKGYKISKYDLTLNCDADLSRLKVEHIRNIIDTFKKGHYDMVIACREKPFEKMDPTGKFQATVSGERLFRKSVIKNYYDLIKDLGNGVEQVINFAHRNKDVIITHSEDLGHIQKHQRSNKIEAVRALGKEMGQLVKTDMKLKRKLFATAAIGTAIAGLFTFWYFSTKKHNGKKKKSAKEN